MVSEEDQVPEEVVVDGDCSILFKTRLQRRISFLRIHPIAHSQLFLVTGRAPMNPALSHSPCRQCNSRRFAIFGFRHDEGKMTATAFRYIQNLRLLR